MKQWPQQLPELLELEEFLRDSCPPFAGPHFMLAKCCLSAQENVNSLCSLKKGIELSEQKSQMSQCCAEWCWIEFLHSTGIHLQDACKGWKLLERLEWKDGRCKHPLLFHNIQQPVSHGIVKLLWNMTLDPGPHLPIMMKNLDCLRRKVVEQVPVASERLSY